MVSTYGFKRFEVVIFGLLNRSLNALDLTALQVEGLDMRLGLGARFWFGRHVSAGVVILATLSLWCAWVISIAYAARMSTVAPT